TVHGAKGLEAPIVILADAASKPDSRQTSRPVYLPVTRPGPLLLHASSKSDHVPETMVLRERENERQQAEYWRKLYVAMTRAEDELYVTGSLTKQARLDGTWYEAIEQTLRPLSEVWRESGLLAASARMTIGASRPLAPCTVMTRTPPPRSLSSRLIMTSRERMAARKPCSEGCRVCSCASASSRNSAKTSSTSRPKRVWKSFSPPSACSTWAKKP
ncbi:MAG: hypothetical protein EOP19_14745, partial [Hyphomicrobiales bacterium]